MTSKQICNQLMQREIIDRPLAMAAVNRIVDLEVTLIKMRKVLGELDERIEASGENPKMVKS